jgi:hypothetical protein
MLTLDHGAFGAVPMSQGDLPTQARKRAIVGRQITNAGLKRTRLPVGSARITKKPPDYSGPGIPGKEVLREYLRTARRAWLD